MTVATTAIALNYQCTSADSEVTYPIAMLYTGMALVATLYPVIGFIADVSCGRFKVVIGCFSLIVVSYLLVYICLVAYLLVIKQTDLEHHAPPPIIVIASIAILLIFVGFAGYQANFIQLGLDQLMTAPSQDLALFVHWATWAFALGSSILATGFPPYQCKDVGNSVRIALLSIPLLAIVLCVVVLFISCYKRQWFTSETPHRNPCKVMTQVLAYARKNKYPVFRSAFTYSDDKRYNRLDFAKERFGGPFKTEQVEDTKSFFKILAVLLALGPVFTLDIPSSYMGFSLFGYHIGNVHNTNHSSFLDHCSSWTLVWSGSLKYISGAVLYPVYIWIIFSCCHRRVPRIFVRLFAGIILYLLGSMSMLLIDVIGHINAAKQNSSSPLEESLCMFHYSSTTSRHLEMHWSVMVLPSVLLGVGPLIVMTTALEFISAQSPHFMKGLLVGILFAIIGVFRLLGAVALIPFSAKSIWATPAMIHNPPITNCGFGYLLFTLTTALVGLISFVIVAKKYTYRVRDDEPYNQSQVEEIVSRYLERPINSD